MLLALFGLPIVVSTILRVPVLAMTETGIRLPLMGVKMRWAAISSVRFSTRPPGTGSNPVLLLPPPKGIGLRGRDGGVNLLCQRPNIVR